MIDVLESNFSVDMENQTWYCFGCQEGGDFESLLEELG